MCIRDRQPGEDRHPVRARLPHQVAEPVAVGGDQDEVVLGVGAGPGQREPIDDAVAGLDPPVDPGAAEQTRPELLAARVGVDLADALAGHLGARPAVDEAAVEVGVLAGGEPGAEGDQRVAADGVDGLDHAPRDAQVGARHHPVAGDRVGGHDPGVAGRTFLRLGVAGDDHARHEGDCHDEPQDPVHPRPFHASPSLRTAPPVRAARR